MKASKKPPKRPTKAQIARMQPLITLCTERLIRSPVATLGGRPVTVDVVWPRDGTGKPKGFPQGFAQTKRHTETTVTIRYVCSKLLDWFRDNLYTTYGGKELMKQRASVMSKLHTMERMMEGEHNLNKKRIVVDLMEELEYNEHYVEEGEL